MLGRNKLIPYGCTCTCGQGAVIELNSSVDALTVFRAECACGRVNHFVYKPARSRTHQKTVDLHIAIHEVFAAIHPPMTVRQVYYQLTTRHAVDKTDAGYDRVQLALTAMRRNGSIPYDWIADNSRAYYQARTHANLTTALADMHEFYRRDLWTEQPVHVEVWLEKRSLVSQLMPVCEQFGVRLYPMGGYASISFAYEAAMELVQIDKPIHVYHLSDLDADGAYSSVALERELRQHGAEFHFHRLALTPQQVEDWQLQDAGRPQKRTASRWNWWVANYGASQPAYELDAIHPDTLRSLVHDAIIAHIDRWQWTNLQRIEREEKESLRVVMQGLK